MSKPDAPTPPDPKDTSSAQTGTNIGTAIANSTMGLIDQSTPYGTLTHSKNGMERYKDPYTGKVYNIPKWSSTISLSDAEKGILDQNTAARTNLAGIANERSDFLGDYFKNSGAATDQIDAKLYELGSKRLDPRFAQEGQALEAKLANQGIGMGSQAYDTAMRQFNEGKNDAYNSLMLTGRGAAMNEVNMPLNQITALLSGSQVNNPQVSMGSTSPAATTDVAGLINQNYAQKYGNWQQKNAATQGLLGGLFGLGAGALSGGFF